MKKSKFMRVAAILMAAVLLTTCAISGTFAKYTTRVDGTAETARVAKWGIGATEITITNLFSVDYMTGEQKNVESGTSPTKDDVIAPGTEGSAEFAFAATGAPEVAYSVTIDTDGSSIDSAIDNNPNILWKLDSGTWGTFSQLRTAIAGLSVARIAPNTLPAAFDSTSSHTVYWKWIFDENAANKETGTANNDTGDTAMGAAAVSAAQSVTLKINFTATQVD